MLLTRAIRPEVISLDHRKQLLMIGGGGNHILISSLLHMHVAYKKKEITN